MKVYLTEKKFMPPIGTFEFAPLSPGQTKFMIKFAETDNSLINLIRDDVVCYHLATQLKTTIPLFSLTSNVQMYNNWDFDKSDDKNLFDNEIIIPTDRVLFCEPERDEDNKIINFSFTIASFFGGPIPEDIALYLFESWRGKPNNHLEIKKFLQICFKNTMRIHEQYVEVKEKADKEFKSAEDMIRNYDEKEFKKGLKNFDFDEE